MLEKRKHIATGQPKGRPKLLPDRLVSCRDCGKELPLPELSRAKLCFECSIARVTRANTIMRGLRRSLGDEVGQ